MCSCCCEYKRIRKNHQYQFLLQLELILMILCEYAYTHNNNCTFIHKSVEDVTGKEIRALLRGADVKILVGCAPCQPFSSHQKDKQNRSKHKDWKLLYQFGRLVEETRPHIVSMENVPELEKEKVFKDFVSTLEGLNYIVNYQVVMLHTDPAWRVGPQGCRKNSFLPGLVCGVCCGSGGIYRFEN